MDRTAVTPLYFNDDQRTRLSIICGGQVTDAEQALNRLEATQNLRLTAPGKKAVTIKLRPNLIQRMKTRCFGRTWPEALEEEVVFGLERYCQLR